MLKHKCDSVGALRQLLEELMGSLDESAALESRIKTLTDQAAAQREACERAGEFWREARTRAAAKLCAEVTADCATLKMPDTQMSFAFEPLPDTQWDEWGTDDAEILFSANLGSPQAPLRLVASGGERSRLMLAMKAAKAKARPGGTIVLDEIDTGVSGDVASRMAELMADISAQQQVFTVTHLPQVAARADHHVEVHKRTEEGTTRTYLKALTSNERIEAIARMLSGNELTAAAIDNAKALLVNRR
jgi:DNA repair protein RecN (Recombination protein N)